MIIRYIENGEYVYEKVTPETLPLNIGFVVITLEDTIDVAKLNEQANIAYHKGYSDCQDRLG